MSAIPTVYFAYDPMCSWCWGYRPTFSKLEKALEEIVDIRYSLGGLAPDSNEPMPADVKQYVMQSWRNVENTLGAKFNFNFWTKCQPRRSTYPACRAVLIARKFNLEKEMYFAIQKAFYLDAKNPSDIEVLSELAVKLGIEALLFCQLISSEEINQQLMTEIAFTRKMPIQGFPSLVLSIKDSLYSIPVDYKDWQQTYSIIKQALV